MGLLLLRIADTHQGRARIGMGKAACGTALLPREARRIGMRESAFNRQ
jgi:hypothetical protein